MARVELTPVWNESISSAVHPWTMEPGWERSIIQAEHESELTQPIKQRLAEGWRVWISGQMRTGDKLVHAAVLFRHPEGRKL